MKKIFNKKLYIVFLCFTVVLGVVQVNLLPNFGQWRSDFSDMLKRYVDRAKQENPDIKYKKFFNTVLDKSRREVPSEDSAREIFEGKLVKGFFPKWHDITLETRIKFMNGFIKYCKKKFLNETSDDRKKLFLYSIVFSMATVYRGYLERSTMGITREHLVGVSVGAVTPVILSRLKVLSHLKEKLRIFGNTSAVTSALLRGLRGAREQLVPYEGDG